MTEARPAISFNDVSKSYGAAPPVLDHVSLAVAAREFLAVVDAASFGASRSFLIESLFRRAPRLAFVTENLTGFALARPGRIATQIGPVVAADEAAAAALLGAALGAASGPVFLDLADRWDGLTRHLQTRGFTVQRPYARMALSRQDPLGNPARLFVVAGPEFG